jgi:hypothetical protein
MLEKMKPALVLALAIGTLAYPQQPGKAAPAVDPKLHADVIKPVELTGVRALMQNGIKQVISDGKARMTQSCTGCDPAFAEEWAKRMVSRINLDDFIDVYIRIYVYMKNISMMEK